MDINAIIENKIVVREGKEEAVSKVQTYDPRFSAINKMKKSGKNSSTILQDNRNLILQLIQKAGTISRKQLSEKTGLQPATVTIIIQELLAQGIIKEYGMADGGSGRGVKTFALVEDLYTVIVRLTAVYIKIALFNAHIKLLYVEKIFFEKDDYITEAVDLIDEHINKMKNIIDIGKILCIVIGVEHMYRLIDSDYKIWDEYRQEYCPIGKIVHGRTGFEVYVNRAINISTYEVWDRFKQLKHWDDDYIMMINIQLSYDLEGTVIINNELIYGANGLCGQLKNLRANPDSEKTLNDLITVPALLRRTNELIKEYPDSYIAQKEKVNIRDVIAGYGLGDQLCKQIYNEVISYIGYPLAQMLELLDPNVILIADEVPEIEEFVEALQVEVAKYTEIEKAKRVGTLMTERLTKNDPTLTGGAKYAFELMFGDIGFFDKRN